MRWPAPCYEYSKMLNISDQELRAEVKDEDIKTVLALGMSKKVPKRVPFGWEFLHLAAWLAIFMWIAVAAFGWAGWLDC